ncbi:tyrosine-type recombinase/integrase [Paraburkholderia sabiae]|uniref:Tyrosine-type recombinase/integrase n=1 Tax=Paraburkholderia sabiae TaxID=273251 RepID=A0ABU9QR90_9BURK|nr:tyrosine-type recombinase/integrase [Paraburkholderia sabiae]WJZ76541.1 tyrosine-type recombinase/integrase [Paraburkholderia sabiae]CAD6552539.1 Tyrosine recombinase XerC [Paraburkholderia sabiae]
MTPADWVDAGVLPARRLPPAIDAALAYVSEVLGHPVYRCWTLADLKRVSPSLADAKRVHPAVFALLLEHDAAIEYWAHGRLHLAPDGGAPAAEGVLAGVLRAHRRRFRYLPEGTGAAAHGSTAIHPGTNHPPGDAAGGPVIMGTADTLALVASRNQDPAALGAWLTRAGRFMNASTTNSLGVADDAQALALFLRDRAQRSPHTLRGYRTELRRLIGWCEAHRRGPLSDLTREDLLAFRRALDQPGHSGNIAGAARAVTSGNAPAVHAPRSDAGRRRALAVISSLFRYWQKTGYLVVNPAVELSGDGAARMTWTPARILPAKLLMLCDAVTAGVRPPGVSPLVWARRCAIWSLYRFAGVRLAELEWSAEQGLPRLSVDEAARKEVDTTAAVASVLPDPVGLAWTLHVHGKGGKVRAIPLPSRCVPVLRDYRVLRGLPAEPAPFESIPLIHSEKRDALGHSGLYDEVKAVLHAAEQQVPPGDAATRALIHAASTHWLRHGYARTLVVDYAVPLPVAQTLLGHASVQTTAAYARTDLTQLRDFVEGSFPKIREN